VIFTLAPLTIADASRAIAARRLSPVELVRDCLARIAARDGTLNSFVHVRAEAALAEAMAAERAIARGESHGPLHGIPIGLKDIIETAGIPTTGQSRRRLGYVPAASAAVAERLAAAGAILLGKHATHEFALGGPSFDLPFPPARNPWDVTRFTGGSSSGSAAAVAAGLCLGAIGTDTSGSIRAPAALCGIAGLKPTRDLVSMRGIFPLSPSQDHAGPMAWTVEDCALLLAAIADPPASASAPSADDLRGLRIGVARRWHEQDMAVSPPVRAAIDAAILVYARLGAIVEEAAVPPLAEFQASGLVVALKEAFALFGGDLAHHTEAFGRLFRDRVALGAAITHSDYDDARALGRRLTAALDAVMARHDVLLTASAGSPAPPLGEVRPYYFLEAASTMPPANVTGLPALALCCGFTAEGLPLGLQLIGRRHGEPALLRAGTAYERATPWRTRRPPVTS
jgi:aspartyl-tRNA(Asn)/glutamyl-tRNA(Gln) amidotransferase subunit A